MKGVFELRITRDAHIVFGQATVDVYSTKPNELFHQTLVKLVILVHEGEQWVLGFIGWDTRHSSCHRLDFFCLALELNEQLLQFFALSNFLFNML